MHGPAQEVGLLGADEGPRHARNPLLEPLELRLLERVEVAHELLGLQDPVDEPVSVAVAEDADAGVRDYVYVHQFQFGHFRLVFIQFP